MEVYRLIHYAEKPHKLFHWRSSHGAEVDLVLETADTLWAIEIRSSPTVKSGNLTGLKLFKTDHPDAKSLCVSTSEMPYTAANIPVVPWKSLFGKDYLNIE